MTWHYDCPDCGKPVSVFWDNLTEEKVCPNCHKSHFPPTPGEDQDAYVATDKWPEDMEAAVIALRGTVCSIPGCFHEYHTLVHRHPASKGGRTCVSNLVQLCKKHAHDKGEQEYDDWVATLSKDEQQDEVPFEIEFTHKRREPAPTRITPVTPPPPPPRRTRRILRIAGEARVSGDLKPGLRLVAAEPFMPGPSSRLVLHYGYDSKYRDSKVILAAWPMSEKPDLSEGVESLQDRKVVNLHDQTEHGAGKLELSVTNSTDQPWVVAVFEEGQEDKPVVINYFLGGTE
ncbi:MAG: HNH endonuclease [candidate division WOR-3 bacterium]|nr:MAG: HNH endonuclease [candidate division WOR-3 bacterium]